jgi:hypothetical protein
LNERETSVGADTSLNKWRHDTQSNDTDHTAIHHNEIKGIKPVFSINDTFNSAI